MPEVNKGTKTELFEAIKDKMKDNSFDLDSCLKLLPGYNHSSKIYAMLEELVEDKKLQKVSDTLYRVKPQGATMGKVNVESFVRDFCKGKGFKKTATRISIAVEHELGPEALPEKILESIKLVLKSDKNPYSVTASSHRICPRCRNKMQEVTLSGDLIADFCPNDRVTLPRKK